MGAWGLDSASALAAAGVLMNAVMVVEDAANTSGERAAPVNGLSPVPIVSVESAAGGWLPACSIMTDYL